MPRRLTPHPLAWCVERYDRDDAIIRAFTEGGYTQIAIAKAVGLSISRVSRLIATGELNGKSWLCCYCLLS